MTLSWDPENVNNNARQLVDSCVIIMNTVERSLVNELGGLPEMPPAVALDVRATLDHTLGSIRQQRGGIAQMGNWLKRRTNHVVDADRFKADLPWYQDVVMGIDGLPNYYRKAPGGGFAAGLLSGTGSMLQDLGTLGGAAIEHNPLVGAGYRGYLKYTGQPSPSTTLVEGWKAAAQNPRATLAWLVRWDLLEKRKFGEWAGYMTPSAALAAITGGAGTTTRVATVTKAQQPNLPKPQPGRVETAKATAGSVASHGAVGVLDALSVGTASTVLAMRRVWSRVEHVNTALKRKALAEEQLANARQRFAASDQAVRDAQATLNASRPQFVKRVETSQGTHSVPDRARLNEWKTKMNARLQNAEARREQAQMQLNALPNRVRNAEIALSRRQALLAAQIKDELQAFGMAVLTTHLAIATAPRSERHD